MEVLSRLFSTDGFMPQGVCYAWTPELLWTMAGANLVTALSCFSIAGALAVARRKRGDQRLNVIITMLVAFLIAVGMTYLIDVSTIWYPRYRIEAFVGGMTAFIAACTAIALWPIVGDAATHVDYHEAVAKELSERNEELAETLWSLQRQRSDLQFLNRFSALLDVSTSELEIADMLGDAMQTLWPGANGALYLRNFEDNSFKMAATWGGATALEAIEGSECWAFRLGRAFPEDGHPDAVECEAAGCGADRHCYPVFGGGETHGLIHMRSLGERGENAAVANLFPTLAERLGLALHNLRLKSTLEVISTRDALTGLFNRRYMEEALALEERRVEREGTECSVIMFDLDHFKAVNDTHGHDVGDAALRLFADVVTMTTRATDVACRYGGEEFIVILPGTSGPAALELGERIRKQFALVSDSNMDSRLRGLRVSGGVACLPANAETMPELLIAADGAMYDAKTAGRDRVELAAVSGPTAVPRAGELRRTTDRSPD